TGRSDRKPARRVEETRHERRFRRRARNVRQPKSIRRYPSEPVSRRQNRAARYYARHVRDRLERRRLQSIDDQRNLRPRNVRNLVQNDRADSIRPRHFTRHYPPLPLPQIQETNRTDEIL